MNNETLTETAAEVEQLIVVSLSEFFEDVVMPRYMKTTKDGVQLTPTWWAEKLGMTYKAVEGRVARLRRSRAQNSPSAVPEWKKRDMRDARRLLSDPETAKEVLKDVPLETVYAAVREIQKDKFVALSTEIEAIEMADDDTGSYEPLRSPERPTVPPVRPEREEGPLAYFNRAYASLLAGQLILEEHGIRYYDLDVSGESIDELIERGNEMHMAITQFQNAVAEAKNARRG